MKYVFTYVNWTIFVEVARRKRLRYGVEFVLIRERVRSNGFVLNVIICSRIKRGAPFFFFQKYSDRTFVLNVVEQGQAEAGFIRSLIYCVQFGNARP